MSGARGARAARAPACGARRTGGRVPRGPRELRARPWHTGTAALVAGLLLGPRAPLAVPLAALAAPALGSRAAVRLALAGAVVTGALVAQARVEAIDATASAPRIGHAVRERVLLLDAPRARPFGVRVATVRLDGERVLLRAGRGVRWPTERVGAVLAVRGGLEPLPASDAWQRARGVHAQLRADALADTGARRGGLAGLVDGVRARAQAVLRSGVPPPRGRPAARHGPRRGRRAARPHARRVPGLRALAPRGGVSGQNVMLLAALVLAVAAVLGVALRARLALVLGAIALYVPLAGGGPSIQRAGVMGAAAVVAVLAGRPAARWHALLLATGGDAGAQPARGRGRRLAAELRGGGGHPPAGRRASATAWSGAGCRAASPRRRRSPPRRRWGPRRSSRRTSARPRWSRCRPTCWPRPLWRRRCGWR